MTQCLCRNLWDLDLCQEGVPDTAEKEGDASCSMSTNSINPIHEIATSHRGGTRDDGQGLGLALADFVIYLLA